MQIEALALKSRHLSEVESSKDEALTNLSKVSLQNESLEGEKINFVTTLQRKNQEIDRLNEEWKTMFEKVSHANNLQCEAKVKLDELTSKETSYQLKERRLVEEKELLMKQKDWFETQLKEKSEAYFTLRKEKSLTIAQLQTSLDAKIDEANKLETLNENLKKENEDLKTNLNTFVDKLKETRDHYAKTEEHYKLELASQSKLALLYKDSSESSKSKCDELVSAVEELQKLLNEANENRVEVEGKFSESEANQENIVKEYDEKIQTLENELKNANDLLEAARQRGMAPMSAETLAALSPTAAATSAFLKSGMTLTQIYNQYIETLDSLEIEKVENGRLKGYLDDILKDIEEKAPLLQEQKKDYEAALITIDKLTTKLENAMKEMENFSMETSEAVQKSEHLRRENERMKILTADLASQVKVLLKECEEARGSVVSTTSSMGLDELTQSYNEVSSSSEVISKRLVTFRNIEELQEQNQRLLTVIRELSEEKEKEEQREKDNKIQIDMKRKLDEALQELEELKDSRQRQTSMVEAVVRQRDMYRVLLANNGHTPIKPRQLLDESQNYGESSKTDETGNALRELQKQFEAYKNERLANETEIKEKNEELQSTIAQLNIKNAQIISQLEHANDRCKLLDNNNVSLKREADALRDKCEKMSLSCAKMEVSCENSKQEMMETKERLMRSEVMYENLTEEKNILKQAEARLLEENKSLVKQQKGQNVLLTNLQTIQNNLERQEYDTRSRLTSQIDRLEQEIVVLKQNLKHEKEQNDDLITSLKGEIAEEKRKVENGSILQKEAENLVETLKSDLNDVNARLSEKESLLSASEARLNEILNRNASENQDDPYLQTLKDKEEEHAIEMEKMTNKFNEAEARNSVLENQITLSKKHLEQYKSMLSANEEALTELNNTSKLFEEKCENEQKEKEKEVASLMKSLTSSQERITILTTENEKLKEQLMKETESLHKTIDILTSEAKEAVKRAELSLEQEKRTSEICEEQKALAAETQGKYQNELLHHASDVQALTTAKQQLEDVELRLAEAEMNNKRAESSLNECKASWEEKYRLQAQELSNIVSRCEELTNQNALLHEQGEKLSRQVLAAQNRSMNDGNVESKMLESAQQSDNRTVNDLWEVIRFVRKEKDIAETKSELLQSECVRNEQRLQFIEKQLRDTESLLEKEKERTKSLPVDDAEYEEIMKKVKMFTEVEETNKILCSEKETLQNKVEEIEDRMKKSESKMISLEQNLKNLTEQKDTLVGEKTGMKNEIQRWRNRVNQLTEQTKNQGDPDEIKKLQEEKKQMASQHKSALDEVEKSKARMEAMRNEITRLQAEINVMKTENSKTQEELKNSKSTSTAALASLSEEKEKLEKEVKTKMEELQEKAKFILQLKKLAKRYKTQYDEVVAEKEVLNKKLSEEKPESDVLKQDETIQTLNSEKISLQQEIEKLNQNLTTFKENEDKSKKTLSSATKRIRQLMTAKEKLTNEVDELKKSMEKVREESEAASSEREMRLSALSTQFEGKQSRMEKELKEKNELIEKYKEEKAKMDEREKEKDSELEKQKKRLQQFERVNRQAQQKIKSQATTIATLTALQSSGTASCAGGNTGVSEDTTQVNTTLPPTAAVKPTATSSTPSSVRSIVTPTASIRPMTSATVQATPRATVPPTVTAQPSVSPIVNTQSTISPTIATHVAVATSASTQVALPFNMTSQSLVTSPTSVTTQSAVSVTVTTQATPSLNIISQSTSTPIVHPLPSVSTVVTSSATELLTTPVRPMASSVMVTMTSTQNIEDRTFEIVSDERPSTSGESQLTVTELSSDEGAISKTSKDVRVANKRSRDYESSSESSLGVQEAKKSKRETVPEVSDVIDEEDVLDVMADDDDPIEEGEMSKHVVGELKPHEVEEKREVVFIDDESEEDDESNNGDEADDDDRKDDIDQQIDIDEDEVVEVIDDDCDDVDDIDIKEELADEDTNEAREVTEEECDRTLLHTENVESTSCLGERPSQSQRIRDVVITTQSVSIITQQPFIRSQSHLAPFSLTQAQSSSGGFDETDDCTVPSTPTLFIPKRTDGFGEMISSPRVHHPSFLFGSTSESNQSDGLAMGMSEEGLRVDDTRFDIMASSGENEDSDLILDNVVPDLDEATAVQLTSDDDAGESSVITAITNTDISEQNVPETGEKFECTDIVESGTEGTKDEQIASSIPEQKTEIKEPEEASSSSSNSASLDSQESGTKETEERQSTTVFEPSTSRGKATTITQARAKSTVVQLRRPLPQTSSADDVRPAVRGRRQIRRNQGRGQSARGLIRRGRARQRDNL
ncbi:nucleoprotein TPR-like isoform X3 [Xenia sp. Carnegie-2017]|uniref:nucleoprotein TPR-like isoform X3 n=1 Tax=Xenia sp. Carnegie-2017 TaxID=2897299 RepID=UPI001F046FE1|nr:nucleoprotein TPR-like isoform X3 [Xenia sp. Carnegie-2017]